jgi:two-component system sensor histidine kinase EvgS
VTERFKVQKKLEAAKIEAEKANIAKSEFLANMSHEIRTPLNAVLGFSELLEKTEVTARQQSYLASIKTGAKTLLSIINDILDLSKIEAGKLDIHPEPKLLRNLLEDIKLMFDQAAREKKLDLHLVIDPDAPKCLVIDETRIRQVLFNLVGNAIKFTHAGYIQIDVCTTPSKRPGCVNLTIDVQDTGIGVPKSQQKKIFESFAQQQGQNNHKYGGTGLGLAISQKLAKIMGGDLSVKSKPGVGSTFSLSLTNIKVAAVPSLIYAANASVEAKVQFQPATILVVDDVESNRNLVKKSFEDSGLQCLEATDGLQAYLMCEAQKPDLILMDIRMSGMNGIEATRKIKANQRLACIPIVALTASMDSEERGTTGMIFDGYLRKPVAYAEMLQELKRFLPHQNIQQMPDITPNIPSPGVLSAEVLAAVHTQALPLKAQAVQSGSFDDIQQFCDRLMAIGKQHQSDILIRYASSLNESVDNFDVDGMTRQLEQFTDLCPSREETTYV